MAEQTTVTLSAASAGQQCPPHVQDRCSQGACVQPDPRPAQGSSATPLHLAGSSQARSSRQYDQKHHSWSGLTTNGESWGSPPPPQLFQFRDLPWEGSWKQGVYQLQTPIHVPRCWLTSTSKEPTVAVSADRPGLTAAPAFCTVSAGSRWDRNSELACEEKKGRILVL